MCMQNLPTGNFIKSVRDNMTNLLSGYKEYKNITNLQFVTKKIVELIKYFLIVSSSKGRSVYLVYNF